MLFFFKYFIGVNKLVFKSTLWTCLNFLKGIFLQPGSKGSTRWHMRNIFMNTYTDQEQGSKVWCLPIQIFFFKIMQKLRKIRNKTPSLFDFFHTWNAYKKYFLNKYCNFFQQSECFWVVMWLCLRQCKNNIFKFYNNIKVIKNFKN